METITTKIYAYNELNDKAKEKAREWYKEGDEHHLLSSDMQEYALTLLQENKIKVEPENIKVYFSLSYSQGDGAMIEINGGEWDKYTLYIKHAGHYSHECSTTIEIQETDNLGFHVTSENEEGFEENVYIPMCKKLAQFGYDTIESLNNDTFVTDALTNNDYQFYSDGTLYIEN